MIVRFFGWSNPINGMKSEWDYIELFTSEEEAGEAIIDYLCDYDGDSSALYEIVREL